MDKMKVETKPYKILFVDDDSTIIDIIKPKLLKHFNVQFALDALEALSIIQSSEDEFAIVISDIFMPHISGIQLLEQVKSISPHTIGMLITARPCLGSAVEAVNKTNIFQFLTKPTRFDTLKQSIDAALEKYEQIVHLRNMSIRDSLTNLYNHLHILDILENEIAHACRYKKKLTILLVDLDNFKSVNDTYGHRFGDQVLSMTAHTLIEQVRNTDFVGRYGGEEFLIIFPETDLEMAYKIAERIRESMEQMVWGIPELKLTISGGLKELGTESFNELINTTDELLYRAKRKGKNRIEK